MKARVGYAVINVEDLEGASPGGAVRFVHRELGAEAFGINWIELPANAQSWEHDESESEQEEVSLIVRGCGVYRVDARRSRFARGRWNLADSKTTIEELRRYLRDESVDAFEEVPGLRFKAWISDELTERWGAVYVWESREAAEQVLPSRARELIGKDPDIGEEFDVEATIEGAFELYELSRRGLAFES